MGSLTLIFAYNIGINVAKVFFGGKIYEKRN